MKIAETFLVAVVGSVILVWCHVPLAWLLGSMIAVILWQALSKRRLGAPSALRQIASVPLGYMLGASFTLETARQIVSQLPMMFALTVSLIIVSLLLGYFVSKKCGLEVESGIFGSVPGGLSQMVLVAEEFERVDVTAVSFMQTIRLLSVVFIVPFFAVHGLGHADSLHSQSLAGHVTPIHQSAVLTDYGLYGIVAIVGAMLASRIGLPAAVLTGPLLATAVLTIVSGKTAPELPQWIVTLSQIVIGTYIGLKLKVDKLGRLRKIAVYTICSSVLLVFLSLLVGVWLSGLTDVSVATGFLSTAPGGVAEMGLTASLVHADLSMVGSYQVFRIFFIMFAIPPLLKWWLKRREARMIPEKQSKEQQAK
ncbi:AbrB family transcriptional regulator [Brevibacillus fulvus]|uniref:Membrane AbrB-like protein n=1 Tax=Brevibacillus fulvus TaxID=1125967 RepID=A0A938XXL2_9BACL|nr:AbrB family transcriptional regulator [Brevibacillus fulvus]MBM7588809.1 membrane AbrB-like protein [Brevibacillus fulvus]